MRENTLKKLLYTLVTDAIWLTYSDIERMIFVGGWNYSPRSIEQGLLNLYREGKFLRRRTHHGHQYMRTP